MPTYNIIGDIHGSDPNLNFTIKGLDRNFNTIHIVLHSI